MNYHFKLDKKWEVKPFLNLAIQLAEIVGEIHQKNIVHNDIKPENILVDQDTKVHLIDFNSATKLSSRNLNMQSPRQIKGTIAYMAPEAFGRMNRDIDNRSDLYSMGIIFYQLLTGNLPFSSQDALELIHLHMAVEVNVDGIQAPLGEIIGKLLAKTPEKRYQSAQGLLHDLLQCQELVTRFGQLIAFPIASKDYSGTFRIPQKLYGRQDQIDQLLEKFEYISNAHSHLLLVSGYSGIGKTALVNETHKPITERKGYFLHGKFDQYQRDVPYYALIQAFNQFIDQLLKEPKSFLSALRDDILNAVGINGQLIIDVIPAVELIIGQQAPIKVLPPIEAQNRFVNTFLNFIKVFAKKEHPLVLMTDDLQWSDQASLDLTSNLLRDEDAQYILIIGAYRDNEVDANHPLSLAIEKLRKDTSEISSIKLEPLQSNDVTELVSDALNVAPEMAKDLSALIFEKTNGNPFFVTQFLNRLHDDELIRFDYQQSTWKWEVNVIRALNITDNVVELMMEKLKMLPKESKEFIRLGACVGNTFDLQTIAAITSRDKFAVAPILWPAVTSRIILPEGENYKVAQVNQDMGSGLQELDINATYQFSHDRIQQASYALIPESERPAIHLRIGRLLLANNAAKVPESLFEIMGHLNAGQSLLDDEDERLRYAQLNLVAGRKAKSSLAHDSAIVYLTQGIALMPHDGWSRESIQSLMFELHQEKAEATYLVGQYEEAERQANHILEKATDPSDQVKIFLLKGLLNTTVGNMIAALDALKKGLKIFGIEVPESVSQELIGVNLQKIESLRAGRPISELFDLPEATSEVTYMKILFLAISATPAFFTDKSLWVWVLTQLVQISIEEGNTDIADLGYAAFGLFIGSSLGQYDQGYEYGKLSLQAPVLDDHLGIDAADEDAFLKIMVETPNKFPLSVYYVAKMRLSYYMGKMKEVANNMPIFLEHMHATLGAAFNTDPYLFQSLSIISLLKSNPSWRENDLINDLERNINQLKIWAENAPMNYAYKYNLILAEKAYWLDGELAKAQELYDLAIEYAHTNGFIHDEGLCSELAGKFYLDRGREKIARTYLTDALRCYRAWGALAKCNQLLNDFPNLLGSVSTTSSSGSSADADSVANLDWKTLLKATATISREVHLEKLLDKFLNVLMENAGAQKCLVIYQDEQSDEFFIEAEASVALANNVILAHAPLAEQGLASKEIVQYVHRTGKTLVLDDVVVDSRFADTEYVKVNQPRSILAIHLHLQNRPSVIIYLENNLTASAFSHDRVEFLTILATQVGISLENALLYRDLEEKVNMRTKTIEEQKQIISQEKAKSDELLYNILPRATADELKVQGRSVPKFYDEVSILFTDFKGFTKITEDLSPEELIETLNHCFLAFDEIIDQYHLSRIKTIGDSYMCAAGVPIPDEDHAFNAVRAGLQIQAFIEKWNRQRKEVGKQVWPLRIGIHSGPVVAGVVGMKKFAYDIWGDAVNVASRMESSGAINQVNISASTYHRTKDRVEVEYRGEVEAKHKGNIEMYFVRGLK